jgi:hypothetical protein
MTLDASGRLGLGTTAPTTLVQAVNNTNDSPTFSSKWSSSGYYAQLEIRNYSSNLNITESPQFRISHNFNDNFSNGYIGFHRGGSLSGGFLSFGTDGSERIRITSGGNVQIGTTSSSDFRLYSYQNASTGNSTTSALVVRQDGTDPIAIFQGSGGSSKMRISSDGKINFSSLPTSASGLSSGDIWNDGGTLKIV